MLYGTEHGAHVSFPCFTLEVLVDSREDGRGFDPRATQWCIVRALMGFVWEILTSSQSKGAVWALRNYRIMSP